MNNTAPITPTAVKDHLLTLPEAAAKYGLPYTRVKGWVYRHHLPVKGRRVFHCYGGGQLLVDERDVTYLLLNPPRNGRPSNSVNPA